MTVSIAYVTLVLSDNYVLNKYQLFLLSHTMIWPPEGHQIFFTNYLKCPILLKDAGDSTHLPLMGI